MQIANFDINPKTVTAANPTTEPVIEVAQEREMQDTPQQPSRNPTPTGWDNSATVPARNVPMHRRKNFEFQHRANAATLIPGEIISNEVKLDMYDNPFIVPEPTSGYVQYLQPDLE